MNINDWSKCYAETSKLESTLIKCLLKDCSDEEKKWLITWLQQSSKTKQKIKEFCENQ